MIDITGKEQLEEFIWENKDKVILIYFGAEWCGPCQKLKNKINSPEVQKEMSNLVVGHIDIDVEDNEQLTNIYNAGSIPLQIFVTLKGTQIVELTRIVGYDWTKFELTYNSIMKGKSERTNELNH